LCLVLLEIIISFANFITPVDYKITINECHDEEIELNYHDTEYYGCKKDSPSVEEHKYYSKEIIIIDNLARYYVFCPTNWSIPLKEVCRPKEVDSIESGKCYEFLNKTTTVGCSDYITIRAINNTYIDYCINYSIKKKSEITKEWLDDNCECFYINGHCDFYRGFTEVISVSDTYNKNSCKLEKGKWIYEFDCPKYKCFDKYEVAKI
jgi:hypothetical protein